MEGTAGEGKGLPLSEILNTPLWLLHDGHCLPADITCQTVYAVTYHVTQFPPITKGDSRLSYDRCVSNVYVYL